MSRRLCAAAALLLAAMLYTGCAFQRIEVNASDRNLNFDDIVVGKTTFMEVLKTYGPPGPISVDEDARRDISKNHLHYAVQDVRTTGLVLRYWLELPFHWSSALNVHETLIEFDDEGKVSHVTQIERKNVRPPFQSLKDHEPATVVLK